MILQRTSQTADCTMGELREDDGDFVAYTLERPWHQNAHRVSCIPAGQYVAKRHQSPKFGECFEVTGVPDRDDILFHAGNTAADSLGCILLGTVVISKTMIGQSRLAVQAFMAREAGEDSFPLTVIDAPLTS